MVVIIPDFLSPADCDAAAACFQGARAAAVDHGDGAAVDSTVRRSRATFLAEHALAGRVLDLMFDVNRRRFKLDLFDVEPLQLAEYGVGDGYGDHLDIGPGLAALRKLSASVQLSDPSTYDGGDLHVWGTGAVERARGSIILFESYLVHRVEPVTRGVRRSLVAWAIGAVPYR